MVSSPSVSPSVSPSASPEQALGAAGNFRWFRRRLSLDELPPAFDDVRLFSAQLDHFQAQAPPSVLAINSVLAVSLVALMWSVVAPHWLLGWCVCQQLVNVGNGMLYRRYQRRALPDDADGNRYWYRLFCVGIVANGLNWGLACSVFYTVQQPVSSIFMVLIIAGLCAGVTAVQSALRAGFMLFVVCALVVPALVLLRFGTDALTVALLMLLYAATLFHIGLHNHRTIKDLLSLRFEHAQLLAQLHASESYFRTLINSAPDMVAVVDRRGILHFQNEQAQKSIGYRSEELLGLCVFDFIHAEDRLRLQDNFLDALQHPGRMVTCEVRWLHRSGNWVMLQGSGRVLDEDNGLLVIQSRVIADHVATTPVAATHADATMSAMHTA